MNKVVICGRLTRDPERKATQSGMEVARFSLALDRGKDKDGKERGADYPTCVAFGKTAENVNRYVGKGQRLLVEGHLTTGSYEKDGAKVYTTEVTVDRVEFMERAEKKDEPKKDEPSGGFGELPDDFPF